MKKRNKTIKAWAVVVNGEPLYPLFRSKKEAQDWEMKGDFKYSVEKIEIKLLKEK